MSTPEIVLRRNSKLAVRATAPNRPGWNRLTVGEFIGRLLPARTHRPYYSRDRSAWLVPRKHADRLIHDLALLHGLVVVYQYGDPDARCDIRCQEAQSERYLCECACFGEGHGRDGGEVRRVLRNRTGGYLVRPTGPPITDRVGTFQKFYVTPGGDDVDNALV